MKKYIITLVFALGLGLNLSAQSDGFFSNSSYTEFREENNNWGTMPLLPNQHGTQYDFAAEAPLGSGLLLLGGLALAYGLRKKNS